jgi:stage IV sporulation protein FB
MLFEPVRSPYDWEFVLFGFHVRISWTFWLGSALLGYGWAKSWDNLYYILQTRSDAESFSTPGVVPLLGVWIVASFLSILVHELGHSLAMNYYGVGSYIVLYHFGGLAVPDGYGSFQRQRLGHKENLVISAAGPLLQITLAILSALVGALFHLPIGIYGSILEWLGVNYQSTVDFPRSAVVGGFFDAMIATSTFWALLNLLPVLPLDGGRIAQHAIGLYRRTTGIDEATKLSVLTCVVVVLYALRMEQPMLELSKSFHARIRTVVACSFSKKNQIFFPHSSCKKYTN